MGTYAADGSFRVTIVDNEVAEGAGDASAEKQDEQTVVLTDIKNAAEASDASLGLLVTGRLYETVAAGQTAQVLGVTGGVGDFISHIIVIPATTSPGTVALLDNATSITIFTGGASSVTNLIPFVVPLNMYSVSGAWKITTGTNVSVIAVGEFAA